MLIKNLIFISNTKHPKLSHKPTKKHFIQLKTMRNNPQSLSSSSQTQHPIKTRYTNIINKLKNQNIQGIKQLQIIFSHNDIIQGQNFIGRKQRRRPQNTHQNQQQWRIEGLALYFQQKMYQLGNGIQIFGGFMQNEMPIGRGIKILVVNQKVMEDKKQVQYQRVKVLYLEKWDMIEGQYTNGHFFEKFKNSQNALTGKFNHKKQIVKGKFQKLTSNMLDKQYKGNFQDNKFQGQGQLHAISQFKYKGYFSKGQKQGLGVQEDLCKKTKYVGQFFDNQRHGYGQLTYLGTKQMTLKGYWEKGLPKSEDCVFIDHAGEFIQTYKRQNFRHI